MVDQKPDEQQNESQNEKSTQAAGVLEDQMVTMVSALERSLASTCEVISNKMKELEKKIDYMEEKYVELAKGNEEYLKEDQQEN